MKKKRFFLFGFFVIVLLTATVFLVRSHTVRPIEPAPLQFRPVQQTTDGKDCFYLFDDNPEHLDSRFLADGEDPSTIAHFDHLRPGVYTVFSYHHRADSVVRDEDLFFDVLFRSAEGAELQINRIGLDHNWEWNQAWADFTGVDVYAPEYLRTFACVCPPESCQCFQPDGQCARVAEECPCTIRDELFHPKQDRYDHLGDTMKLGADDVVLMSNFISQISEQKMNQFRYGGYDEPMWMMLEFEVLSGELTLDTVAYTNQQAALKNVKVMKPGVFAEEPQYKGIARNAPVVRAELSYTFDDRSPAGGLPVRIFNQRYPNGFVAEDGAFGTHVNTWKREEVVAAESAESDLMQLEYEDESKGKLFGPASSQYDTIWRFDPFHTKLYSDDGDLAFVPNVEMSRIPYPKGGEETSADFYDTYVCNLGNFGVRYLYTFHLNNEGAQPRTFRFSMNSFSGQVYRFTLKDKEGRIIRDDGGRYLMKRFDTEPAEDPNSTSEPKERLEAAKYTSAEEFRLEPKQEYQLEFEVVTLTGCIAPMTNTITLE